MNKIIGLLTGWGVEDWIRPAIKQALEYCDEVVAVIAPFTPELKKFEDNTYNICKEYLSVKLLDYKLSGKSVQEEACGVFNLALKNAALYSPGNWVWKLDSDEFYANTAYKMIKLAIESNKYDLIDVEGRIFYIDMRHFLEDHSPKVLKIMTMSDGFFPTCKWCRPPKNVFILPRSAGGLFHYSMLKNTEIQRAKWWAHPPFDVDGGFRVRWLEKIYANYDLENEDYWIEENRKLIGRKTPWCDGGYKPDENGRLFRYEGSHPKFIEEANLTRIEDFREYNKRKQK